MIEPEKQGIPGTAHLDWTSKYIHMTLLKVDQPLSSRVLPVRRKPRATECARRRMGWIWDRAPHEQTLQQEFCEDWQGAVSVDPDAIELALPPRTASSITEGLSFVGFEVTQSGCTEPGDTKETTLLSPHPLPPGYLSCRCRSFFNLKPAFSWGVGLAPVPCWIFTIQ